MEIGRTPGTWPGRENLNGDIFSFQVLTKLSTEM